MGPAGPGPGPGRQGRYATFFFGGDFFEKVVILSKKSLCFQKVLIFFKKSVFSSKVIRDKPESIGNGLTSSGPVYLYRAYPG